MKYRVTYLGKQKPTPYAVFVKKEENWVLVSRDETWSRALESIQAHSGHAAVINVDIEV